MIFSKNPQKNPIYPQIRRLVSRSFSPFDRQCSDLDRAALNSFWPAKNTLRSARMQAASDSPVAPLLVLLRHRSAATGTAVVAADAAVCKAFPFGCQCTTSCVQRRSSTRLLVSYAHLVCTCRVQNLDCKCTTQRRALLTRFTWAIPCLPQRF